MALLLLAIGVVFALVAWFGFANGQLRLGRLVANRDASPGLFQLALFVYLAGAAFLLFWGLMGLFG